MGHCDTGIAVLLPASDWEPAAIRAGRPVVPCGLFGPAVRESGQQNAVAWPESFVLPAYDQSRPCRLPLFCCGLNRRPVVSRPRSAPPCGRTTLLSQTGPAFLAGRTPRVPQTDPLAPHGPDPEAARPGDGSGQPHRGTAGRGRSSR